MIAFNISVSILIIGLLVKKSRRGLKVVNQLSVLQSRLLKIVWIVILIITYVKVLFEKKWMSMKIVI